MPRKIFFFIKSLLLSSIIIGNVFAAEITIIPLKKPVLGEAAQRSKISQGILKPKSKPSKKIEETKMKLFKRFGIDLRYQMANKETIEERQDFNFSATGVNQADIYSYKPSQISLSLNIFLFRTNADDIGGAFANLFKNNKCYCPY